MANRKNDGSDEWYEDDKEIYPLLYDAKKINSFKNTELKEHIKHIANLYTKNDLKKWKIPDKDSPLEPPVNPSVPVVKRSSSEILAPLDSVFLDDDLKDEIVVRTAIPDLLEGTVPAYSGVILFGPPGTGKTVLLKAVSESYVLAGAYAKELSVSALNSKWVGDFPKNLEEEIQKALKEAKRRDKPSFLYFDEGSILAQKAAEGSTSVSKHYQEAIDVLKRYLGNERSLVLGITTNLLSESFEEALTREGRLTTFFIGYPDEIQRGRMWKHFASQYISLDLADSEAGTLAAKTPEEQGAFIEEFCRGYMRSRRKTLLKQRGYNTICDALKKGASIKESDVKLSINYDTLISDLGSALDARYERQSQAEKVNGHKTIGFGQQGK